MDSIQIKYESEKNIFNFSKAELQDPSLPWWEKSILYTNYFWSGVRLFLPIKVSKEIWEEGYENDPYTSCENLDIEYERIKTIEYNKNIPFVEHCLLMREKYFFKSRCNLIYEKYDPTLINKLSSLSKNKISDSASRSIINGIIQKLGKYPGRSIVGIELESVASLVIQNGDLEYMNKYLFLLQDAVKNGDLHPRYLASIIDKMEILKHNPQIYGTQYKIIDGKSEIYPIKNMENLDKLRKEMGLSPLTGSHSSLGDLIISQRKKN